MLFNLKKGEIEMLALYYGRCASHAAMLAAVMLLVRGWCGRYYKTSALATFMKCWVA